MHHLHTLFYIIIKSESFLRLNDYHINVCKYNIININVNIKKIIIQ